MIHYLNAWVETFSTFSQSLFLNHPKKIGWINVKDLFRCGADDLDEDKNFYLTIIWINLKIRTIPEENVSIMMVGTFLAFFTRYKFP
jgi:hypothetical protein